MQRFALFALLAVAVFTVYGPVLHGEWLWDDNVDISENLLLRSRAGLWNVWFAPTTLDYYPLKYTVHWILWHLWGDQVVGYHLINILLHLASAVLVWRILRRLGVGWSWFGALCFAVHPMAVESVAWMAELKNALALPPLLLAFDAWLDFDTKRGRYAYIRAIAWFVVSMLSKTSGVMFPFALLLFAFCRHGAIRKRHLVVVLPFVGVSVASGAVTLWFQYARALGNASVDLGSGFMRAALAGSALAHYVGKAIWPYSLVPIYARWPLGATHLFQLLPLAALFAAIAWMVRLRTPTSRLLLFASGWFVLHLVPFLGVVPISYMRFTWVMDHLAYFSLPAMAGVAAGLGAYVSTQATRATHVAIPALAGLAALSLLLVARNGASHYRTAAAFWTYELQHNPDSAIAHNNLGLALERTRDLPAAMRHYASALRLDPSFFEARINYGNTLVATGRYPEAISELQRAAAQMPRSPSAHFNLALAFGCAQRGSDALRELDTALELRPDWPEARDARGTLLRQLGRPGDAIADLEEAVRLAPDSADFHHDLALALADAGRPLDALPEYQRALQLAPNRAEIHNNLGTALAALGRMTDAVTEFARAVALRSQYTDAQLNLGIALLKLQRPNEAIPQFDAVLARAPDSLRAHYNLALALAATGRLPEAREHYAKARGLDPTLPAAPF